MINKATIDLIKEFEGFSAEAYLDPIGLCTIGYGTTERAGVGIVPVLGMAITKAEAEWYLEQTVIKFAKQIRPSITAPINENEFGAYVSLAYNIGPGAFKKSSSLRHFNEGNKEKAAVNILLWNKAGGKVLRGLVRRREAEKRLFLTDVLEVVATPSSPVKKEIGTGVVIGGGILVVGIAIGEFLWDKIETFLNFMEGLF